MSVSAAGRSDIWTVGSQGGRGFAEHWNGERWKIADIPNPRGADELEAMAWIPGTGRFIAGGSHQAVDGTRTFPIELGPGGWTYSSLASRFASIRGAAAGGPRNAWLVGKRTGGDVRGYPFAAHRTARGWRRVEVPYPGFGGGLEDVDVVPGSHQAWAVGGDDASTFQSMAYRWRNGHWKHIATPFDLVVLTAVEALARNDVWIAGWKLIGEIDRETFIAHWDGSGWEVSPSGTGHLSSLEAIAAIDSDDIWAAGDTSYFLHWNGASWSEVDMPGPPAIVYDITRVPGSQRAWAVGQRYSGGTVTMRYCG